MGIAPFQQPWFELSTSKEQEGSSFPESIFCSSSRSSVIYEHNGLGLGHLPTQQQQQQPNVATPITRRRTPSSSSIWTNVLRSHRDWLCWTGVVNASAVFSDNHNATASQLQALPAPHGSGNGPHGFFIFAPHAPTVYRKKLNVDFFDDERHVVDSLDTDPRYCNQTEVRLVREEYYEYLIQFKILKSLVNSEGLAIDTNSGVISRHVVGSNDRMLQFLKTLIDSRKAPAVASSQTVTKKPSPSLVLAFASEVTEIAHLAQQQQQQQLKAKLAQQEQEQGDQKVRLLRGMLAKRELQMRRQEEEQESAIIILKALERQDRQENLMLLQLQEQQRVRPNNVSNGSRVDSSQAHGSTDQMVHNHAISMQTALMAVEPDVNHFQKLQLLKQRRQQQLLFAKRKNGKRGPVSVRETPSTSFSREFDVLCENATFSPRITLDRTISSRVPPLSCNLASNPDYATYHKWMKDKRHAFERAAPKSSQRNRIVTNFVDDIIANNRRFREAVERNVPKPESTNRKYSLVGKVRREMEKDQAFFDAKLSVNEVIEAASFLNSSAIETVGDSKKEIVMKVLNSVGGATNGESHVQQPITNKRLNLSDNPLRKEVCEMRVDILKKARAMVGTRKIKNNSDKSVDCIKQISDFPCDLEITR
eukprot:jgi/Psemu1/28332/gm1.28332_g